MQYKHPSWVDLDPDWDNRILEGTALTFRGARHLKKTQSNVSTLAYLNRRTPILIEYQVFNKLKDKFDLVPERDNKSEYHPVKLVGQLARYGKRPDISHVDRLALEQAKKLAFRAFGGSGELFPDKLDDGLRFVTKVEKSSGLPELTKKGEAFDRDLARAQRIAAGSKVPDPCVAYHRIQHGDQGPKTRLVWGYPQSMFLLEAKYAPKLIDQFMRHRTPMVFGLKKFQVSARMQQIQNSWLRYSLDFSGFDSSIHEEFIRFAFGVLRTHFTFNSWEDDAVWEKIERYFIHTPIMMPDTQVWVKHHGVPSGSYFTQMVDSIVNYMAVQYAWIRATGLAVQEGRVLVLGDDSLVGQSKKIELDVLSSFMAELGLNLNVKKTELSYYGRSVPHFLGHYWWGGFARRPQRELAIRMAFPEKPSGIHDGTERAVIRVLSYVADSLNAGSLVREMAPTRVPWIEQEYVSFFKQLDPDLEIEASMRPGLQAHLEEEGILEATTPWTLVSSNPMLGPWS